MLNYNSLNECSNFDEVKSEMDNINSISYNMKIPCQIWDLIILMN